MTRFSKTAFVVVAAAVSVTAQPAPPSEWDITGSGDSTIQGFTTDISVNVGETVQFKVNSTAQYRLDIYRMGYYSGNGASKIATVGPIAGQSQPACLTQPSTGLVDCGNWSVTATWAVPANAKSGIYFAKAVKTSGTGASHIFFVVRDDASRSDIVFQTADTTWQAYNRYGGNSLYTGSPAGRAYKVSYNRPFTTRAYAPEDWVFNAEYPMVRWLEANGYDVTYTTGIDSDRRGDLIRNHKVFLSVGHDEYWSGGQRANVEAARAAGVHLMFLSGNEVFWKTRWENSISASADSHRTLVCYKETSANAKIDPSPEWTGTWRDPRFSPPSDGGRPENALTGTIFTVNCCDTTMSVPAEFGGLRFWRNTSIATLAPGASATLPNGVLGYEWDEDLDNGFRPPGLIRLSRTTHNVSQRLQDYGSSYGAGTATHALTLYRHPGGALVFGAGSIQWSWGLDSNHDRGGTPTDIRMQQATVNMLADMGAQPTTLQPGLILATASTDTSLPVSTITAPAAGSTVPFSQTSIAGTASDIAGAVGGVEVSVDGGATWRTATGTANWTFVWTPTAVGNVTIMSRAIDDSGNVQNPPASISVTVGGSATCPCTIFGAAVPSTPQDSETSAVELGVKFRSDVAGYVTGVRFYKGPNNTGTHIGSLWSSTGTRLANVTFTNETASGWQQAIFASPVAISANVTYVVSYHAPNGRYAIDSGYFTPNSTYTPPLRALANGTDGGNGVYRYGAAGSFPNGTWNSSNYWVDVVFAQTLGPDVTPPVISAVNATAAQTTATITWTTDEASNSRVDYGTAPGSLTLNADDAANVTSHSVTLPVLTAGTTYYYRVTSADAAANSATSPQAPSAPLSFTTTAPDTTPPVISSISAAPASNSAVITWTTNEASNSRVDYGAAPDALTLSVSDGANVTSHGITLTGLTAGGTYYYRVTSADALGNSATSPVPGAAPLSFLTTPPDTTPPAISAVAAVPGSTTARITWTTNEISNSLVDYGLSSALGLAATNAAMVTAHSVDLTGLTPGTTYYYRVSSADAAGNPASSPAAPGSLTFTTSTTVLTRVFSDSDVPATLEDTDTAAVELGMKFRSDVNGTVTGIRFYKGGPNNTGLHVGKLWSSTGVLLASVTFTNETASGWQHADLPVPVAITAGTTYIVSYHAPNGRYSKTTNYFQTSGLYNAPLYALRNGVSGSNGVYLYGAGGFPNQTYTSTNYWVDAVVSSASGPVRVFPASTTIETGTARTGSAAQLGSDDNAFFGLNSTTSGTRTAAWYATFSGVPNLVSSLKAAYAGKNSRNCTETVSIWNWNTSAWVQLNSSTVGTSEVLRSNLAPASGLPGDYVSGSSGTGDVRVRVACSTTANFNTSADLVSITYEP